MNKWNQRGATTILIALSMAALIAILITTILTRYASLNSATQQTKSTTEGEVAIADLAQVVLQGYQEYKVAGTCPSGKTARTVRGATFCLPNGTYCAHSMNQATNPKYCFSTNPVVISSIDKPTKKDFLFFLKPNSKDNYTKSSDLFLHFLFPPAFAQTGMEIWRPDISGAPTVQIYYADCLYPDIAGDPKSCVRCQNTGFAARNADCFKVRICTNGNNTCTAARSYIEPVIAIGTN